MMSQQTEDGALASTGVHARPSHLASAGEYPLPVYWEGPAA